MDIKIDSTVLEGVVKYISATDSIMAKQAAMDSAVGSEVDEVITKLAAVNLLPEATKEASIAKVKEDPTYMIDLLKQAASVMQTEAPAGVGVEPIKQASAGTSADDKFVAALLA